MKVNGRYTKQIAYGSIWLYANVSKTQYWWVRNKMGKPGNGVRPPRSARAASILFSFYVSYPTNNIVPKETGLNHDKDDDGGGGVGGVDALLLFHTATCRGTT